MPTPSFNEATIRAHAASESFERGMSYYRRGATGYLTLAGNVLTAEVEGAQPLPYRVQATFDQGGITSASCDCPYEGSGWCKHIVAMLLAYLHDPANVAERPALDVLLASADRDRLAALLLRLAEHDPRLADSIARELTFAPALSPAPAALATPARRTPLDTQPIRQQVQFALRTARRGGYDRYDSYYDDEADPGDAVVEAMRPLLAQAQSFIDSGDAHSALAMLEAITEEYIEGCDTLVEQISDMMGGFEGSAADFFDDIAAAWAEALLSTDLSAGERDEWGERLAGWADATADYGVSEAFEIAITAADQGWDYLPLRRVLQGTITEQGTWAGEPPAYADQLSLIRLKALDRQGRHEEYLHLAEAEGQIQRFVVKLAQLGRTQAAVAEGLKMLDTPAEALELAQALRAQNDLAGALQIAEHGLGLQIAAGDESYAYLTSERQRAELAAWTADLALGMGEHARALRAAEVGFRAQPNLVAYLKAQELAGASWAAHKPGLLEHLRTSHATDAKVDIFLREQLIDDAIAAVKDSYGYMLLERVMDAAISSRPDWVIRAASAQAERIMNAGKADRYDQAVNWLRRAKAAYQADGRSGEWQEYIRNVRSIHGRKYKLIGLLTKL